MLLSLLAQATDVTTDFSTTAADEAAAAAVGTAAVGVWAGMMIFWVIFSIVGFALFLWALIDVIRRQFPNQNDKILWVILIIVLGIIGPILYLLIGRKKGTLPA